MIKKSVVLARAGLLPAAAALALMGHIAARAEVSPQATLQRAPESELGTMKVAATEAPKDQAPAKAVANPAKPADPAAKPGEQQKPADQTAPATATATPSEPAKPAAATPAPTPPAIPATAPAQAPADAAKKDAAAAPASTTPAAAANTPAATAALPDAAPDSPPPASAPAVAPAPPADPIVAAIRQRIPEAAKGANPDDVKALAESALAHRLIIKTSSSIHDIHPTQVVAELLETTPIEGITPTGTGGSSGGPRELAARVRVTEA